MGRKSKLRFGIQLVRSYLGLLHLHITEVQWELFLCMTSVGDRHLIALADGLMNRIVSNARTSI